MKTLQFECRQWLLYFGDYTICYCENHLDKIARFLTWQLGHISVRFFFFGSTSKGCNRDSYIRSCWGKLHIEIQFVVFIFLHHCPSWCPNASSCWEKLYTALWNSIPKILLYSGASHISGFSNVRASVKALIQFTVLSFCFRMGFCPNDRCWLNLFRSQPTYCLRGPAIWYILIEIVAFSWLTVRLFYLGYGKCSWIFSVCGSPTCVLFDFSRSWLFFWIHQLRLYLWN